MTTTSSTAFRITCIQTHPAMLDVAGNVAHQVELIRAAAAEGSKLIVLPECSTTGWVFESRAEAATVAESVPDGPTCTTWLSLCRELDIHIVAGIVERQGDRQYNSAVLLGPAGHIGTFRKAHLWAVEKEFYDPGDLGFPVFETPLGRIAMHICYDGWFSESYRIPALCDADLLCVPANWVPIPNQPDHMPKMAESARAAPGRRVETSGAGAFVGTAVGGAVVGIGVRAVRRRGASALPGRSSRARTHCAVAFGVSPPSFSAWP